jgi:hypothetical protein
VRAFWGYNQPVGLKPGIVDVAKGIFAHHRGTFYRQPCEMEGFKFPPIMITLTKFAATYNYSKDELLTLLRDKHLFGKTFKKNMWVCPCPTSYLWASEIIAKFWTKA